MENDTPKMTYGKIVRWVDMAGTHQVSVAGFVAQEEANAKAREIAEKCGWYPPRWWQIWRRKDERNV